MIRILILVFVASITAGCNFNQSAVSLPLVESVCDANHEYAVYKAGDSSYRLRLVVGEIVGRGNCQNHLFNRRNPMFLRTTVKTLDEARAIVEREVKKREHPHSQKVG